MIHILIHLFYYVIYFWGAAKRFRLAFSVMSSEQDASRFPVGSHLIALTSFCGGRNQENEEERLLGTVTLSLFQLSGGRLV